MKVWIQGRDIYPQAAADELLSRLGRTFDTWLLYVARGLATYQSQLMDCYYPPGYDSLAYVIQQAHARGVCVEAWWCVGGAPRGAAFRVRYPGWDIADLNGIDVHWLNFSLPEVREFVGDVVLDLVENYDVDGVHLDYIRWPAGGALGAATWRDFFSPDDVPATVESVYRRLKAVRPEVRLTAAVMAHRLGASHGQFWRDWLDGGYIDQVMPMTYYPPSRNDDLAARLAEWKGLPRLGDIYPRLMVRDDGVTKTPEEMREQIEMCALFPGVTLFHAALLLDEILEELEEVSIVSVVTDLQAVEDELRAQITALADQADAVAQAIADLVAVDDALDAAARVIEDD